jgi:hypothetical protein
MQRFRGSNTWGLLEGAYPRDFTRCSCYKILCADGGSTRSSKDPLVRGSNTWRLLEGAYPRDLDAQRLGGLEAQTLRCRYMSLQVFEHLKWRCRYMI